MDHVSWINTFDGDISYQVDRLLLNAQFPGYSQISSTDVDYGSELFLLVPMLKAFNLLFGSNPLHSYYVITVTHIVCGLAALFVLSHFLSDYLTEKFFWISAVLLSPLFGFHMAYIKPDANVVLLLVSLSLYFSSKINENSRYTALAIFFAAFGFAIKWWGIFCLVPIFVTIAKTERKSDAYLRAGKIALISSSILIIPVSHFLVNELVHIFTKNNISNIFTRHSPILWKTTFSIICFLFFLASFKLFTVLLKKGKKLYRLIADLLLTCMVFTSSYLLIAFPFIASGFYIKSLFSFAVGVFKVNEIGSDSEERRSITENILFWLSEFRDYHYFSPILLLAFAALVIYFFVKSKKKATLAWPLSFKSTGLFLGAFNLFIFVLLNRNNRAMIAMLYPIYLIFFFSIFAQFKNSIQKIVILFILTFVQISYQAQGKFGNLTSIYFERDVLRANVHEANKWLSQNFPEVQEFYLCDYAFPQVDDSRFKFHYFWRYHCNTNLEQDLRNLKKGEAWILASETLNKFAIDHTDVLRNKKITPYEKVFVAEKFSYSVVEIK